VKDLGAVVSFHFVPKVDSEGKLRLDLARVMGGRLPLPDVVWESHRTRIVGSLNKWIPIWQQSAKVDPQGMANQQAMFVTLGRLVLKAANHQAGEPFLFLPLVEGGKAVPVKVIEANVEGDALSMKVRRLSGAESASLTRTVRGEPLVH
jgi:hypothetical protein